MNRFNWADIIAVILLFRMGYIGFRTGLWTEMVKLSGLTVGFFFGFRYYQSFGDIIAQKTFLRVEWASALMMAGLVVMGYWGVSKFLGLLEKVMQVSFQDKLSRMGGLLVGILRGGLVTSVVLVVCQQLPSPSLHSSIEERSLTGHAISRMAPMVFDRLTAAADRLQQAF